MLTRGQTKRILRQATQMRIRAEREIISAPDRGQRWEEGFTRDFLKTVPSVFAFAEKLNSDYERPFWASQRYGAK